MTDTPTTVREQERDLIVKTVETSADGVVVLTLVDPDGGSLPAWTPGAHVDLILAPDLVRQYSLCGSASDTSSIRIAVLRSPGSRGGSAYVHDGLKPGTMVRVRGPRNHFPLVGAPRYLFIAGGIGITPLMPMLAEATAAGADWSLVYLGRSRRSMAFLDELEQYGDRVRVMPKDETGRFELDTVLTPPRDDTAVYCCGPERLLSAVEERCATWPAGALHVERFAARAPEATDADQEFELVLARSGLTVTVPAGRSVFDAVQDAGVSVLGSCHEGLCGTCEQIVLDGEIDHRDSVLNAQEQASNEMMMICVSRSLSARLTLDL